MAGKQVNLYGKSHGMSLNQVKAFLKERGMTPSEISWQIRKGLEIEMEHTEDQAIAQRIAFDHLVEYPDYYYRLVEMEKEAEKYWKSRK